VVIQLEDPCVLTSQPPREKTSEDSLPIEPEAFPSKEPLTDFTKSFVYRWLGAIRQGLRVYEEWPTGRKYRKYHRLRRLSDELFASYSAFCTALASEPLTNDVILSGPLYAFEFADWLRNIQSPIRSNQTKRVQGIKAQCSKLIGELEEVKTILKVWEESLKTKYTEDNEEIESEDLPDLPRTPPIDDTCEAEVQLEFAHGLLCSYCVLETANFH
jgi:hypothetical protein